MNRIAVVSMMKNEADIVESWARHAFQFADKIFVCDHKSTDRTREILESLQSEGLPIEISTFDRDELAMSKINTNLMSKAFSEGFDLVVPIDADRAIFDNICKVSTRISIIRFIFGSIDSQIKMNLDTRCQDRSFVQNHSR